VHNALAAIAAGLAAGVPLAKARDALERAKSVRGRMERVDCGQPFSVIVDYATRPESLDKVLGLLRPLTKGRLIAVFGSAGERTAQATAAGRGRGEARRLLRHHAGGPAPRGSGGILAEIERAA